MKKQKILFLANGFKGHFSSKNVLNIFEIACQNYSNIEFISKLIADGGDDTLEAIHEELGGKFIHTTILAPIKGTITTTILLSCQNVYIDYSRIAGFQNIAQINKKSCLYSSSFGLGQAIYQASQLSPQKIYVNLGGSITTDSGFGALSELGLEFYDKSNCQIKPCAINMQYVSKIVKTKKYYELTKKLNIILNCDVTNPLVGRYGTARVFARQKGADNDTIDLLEKSIKKFAQVLENNFQTNKTTTQYGGSAGGVAFGLMTAFNAIAQSGFEYISQIKHLEKLIKNSDYIITCEGSFDSQSLQGKATGNIINLCQKYNKKIGIICALNQNLNHINENTLILSMLDKNKNIADKHDLESTITRLLNLITQNKF